MIKHIVLWKIKAHADGVDKAENIRRMKELLEALPGHIAEIRAFEVGVNTNPSDTAWDVALYSEFAAQEDLDRYQKHPEHVKVAEFVRKVRDSRAVVDYEV